MSIKNSKHYNNTSCITYYVFERLHLIRLKKVVRSFSLDLNMAWIFDQILQTFQICICTCRDHIREWSVCYRYYSKRMNLILMMETGSWTKTGRHLHLSKMEHLHTRNLNGCLTLVLPQFSISQLRYNAANSANSMLIGFIKIYDHKRIMMAKSNISKDTT